MKLKVYEDEESYLVVGDSSLNEFMICGIGIRLMKRNYFKRSINFQKRVETAKTILSELTLPKRKK